MSSATERAIERRDESQTLDQLPELLTVEEYRHWVRIGRNQAYAAIKRGDVPSIRIGRTIRIPRHALVAQVTGNGGGG